MATPHRLLGARLAAAATTRSSARRSLASTHSGSVRAKSSSSAAPRVATDADAVESIDHHHHHHNQHNRTLTIADWAENSLRIQPRATLAPPVDTNVFTSELPSHISAAATVDAEADAAAAAAMSASRAYISDAEADKWLADFEIPAEQLAQCESPAAVAELRRLYARQLRLECSVYEMAMDKHEASSLKVRQLGRASNTNAAKELIRNWMGPAQAFIENEQRKIRDGKHSMDSNIYGPALLMLKADVLAATGMNVMLNTCLGDAHGPKFIKLALAMGKAIQEEIIVQKERAEKRGGAGSIENKFYLQVTAMIESEFVKAKMKAYHDDVGGWDKRINLKVGAALIDCIQRSCFLPTTDKNVESNEPAFLHDYVFERNRRAGVIKIHPTIANTVLSTKPGANVLPWTARYLPMLVPPKHWDNVVNGGYLKLHTKIMRQRDSAWQMDCVKRGEMQPLFKALNLLADVPWVINREVLDVILKVWENGGGFGDLPQRTDIELPPWKAEYEHDPEAREAYDKMVRKIQQRNQELHSLRCDTLYKLQVAEEFKDEQALYYPYNMDFRGRVYPIPPNLNHLGSDLSRSLLIFRDRKPLGPDGLRWLKIHLANVFGVDKCSFDERVAFTDAHIDKAIASALEPFGESSDCSWWKDADYPFLALGVCFELQKALASPDPALYESNIPIHQDGSCNGLQHYAALGRDELGGQQVNLVPADRPSDVYTGVATQVMRKVERDAAMELPETIPDIEKFSDDDSVEERARKSRIREQWHLRRRKTHAQFLLGTITRKVVKQTVMTSVYGVTYIGARKQISARLEEVFLTKGMLMDAALEDQIYHASCYAAEVTMESMGDLFTSARNIMTWLGDCASKVASNGQAMSWITPLGLPVVQPYRRNTSQQVRTKVQHVLMVLTEQLPVSTGRQKTAFPPNFVHSLDSTHMLLTAVKCLEEDQIAFAAVHDSYWTHACSVDTMNARLREQFVFLYDQPLLEELLTELRLRFPKTEFQDIPELGTLDLSVVKDSPYFFN